MSARATAMAHRTMRGAHMITITFHAGPRTVLRPLFELAEDSEAQLDAYMDQGCVLVARVDGEAAGFVQLTATEQAHEIELKSMAVAESMQGAGLGRRLVDAAVAWARSNSARRMLVATATADVGNLRFYQRVGFRMCAIERDAFVPSTGYPDEIVTDGIVLRDRVWLDRELTPNAETER